MNRRSFMKSVGLAVAGLGLVGSVQASKITVAPMHNITQEDLIDAYKSMPDYSEQPIEIEVDYDPDDIIVYPKNVYVLTSRPLPDDQKIQFLQTWTGSQRVNFVNGVFREHLISLVEKRERSSEIKENK